MKDKIFLLLIVLVGSINTQGQGSWVQGYFVRPSGDTTHCLLEDKNWKNNPTSIQIKHNHEDKSTSISIDSLQGFGTESGVKYIRATVDIDESTENLSFLASNPKPIFREKTVLLKHLIKGDIDLYFWRKGSILRFFYAKNDTKIRPLVYKKFKVGNSKIAFNLSYRDTLKAIMQPSCIKLYEFEGLAYTTKDMIKLFEKYHACNEKPVVIYKTNEKMEFGIKIKPGYYFNNFKYARDPFDEESYQKMEDLNTINWALELEMLLPWNQKKWAMVSEINYSTFSKKNVYRPEYSPEYTDSIHYERLDVVLGLRYNMNVSEDIKVFLTPAVVSTHPLNSSFSTGRNLQTETKIFYHLSFQIRLGVSYKNISAEVLFEPQRDIFNSYTYLRSKYSTIGVNVGYQFKL